MIIMNIINISSDWNEREKTKTPHISQRLHVANQIRPSTSFQYYLTSIARTPFNANDIGMWAKTKEQKRRNYEG